MPIGRGYWLGWGAASPPLPCETGHTTLLEKPEMLVSRCCHGNTGEGICRGFSRVGLFKACNTIGQLARMGARVYPARGRRHVGWLG